MTQAERTVLFKMPEARQARLVGLAGSVKGKVFPLSLGTFVLGRGDECDLRLKDAGISRVHAKIVAEGTVHVVQDHESRNGTLVNGEPVRSAELREGDQLSLCSATFRFTYANVVAQPLPPEFEDHTDEVQEAPPHAVTSPGLRLPGAASPTAAPAERGTRLLALVAAIGSITAIVGVGVVVAVVLSRPPPVVVVQGAADKEPAPLPQPRLVADAGPPRGVEPDAGGAASPSESDAGAQVEDDPAPKKGGGRKSSSPSSSAWLPARTGPEVARAPADGKVISIAAKAEAGQPFLAIEGQPPIAAPASGDVTAVVRAGDTVRRGQVVGRIAETRARAELPAGVRKRARPGALVELRLSDGSTKNASVAAVVGATVFVETDGTSVDALRLR